MLRNLFILFLVLFSFKLISAQENLTEGIVNFKITYPKIPASQNTQIELLPSEMKIYFKGNKCRIVTKSIQGDLTRIINLDSMASWDLSEFMGKKIAVRTNLKEIRKLTSENFRNSGTIIKSLKGRKKILGYSCKGFSIKEKSGLTLTYYFSEQLPPTGDMEFSDDSICIKGMLLDYDQINEGMLIHYRAFKIENEIVPDGYFLLPPGTEVMMLQKRN